MHAPCSRRALRAPAAAAAAAVLTAASALAQQSFYTPSGTQPGEGVWTLKPRVEYREYRYDPHGDYRSTREIVSSVEVGYGITKDLAIYLEIPTIQRTAIRASDGARDHDFGLGDIGLLVKYRVLRLDTSPIDTARFSILAGLELPTGTSPLGSDSWDPTIGFAGTIIRGRHGVNLSSRVTFNTGTERPGDNTADGPADELKFDAAYLFRLAPERYTRDTTGSCYLVGEINGLWMFGDGSGDAQIVLSPGVLYEGTTWALEVAVQIPVWQKMHRHPEMRFGIGVELRFQF